jgi:hypothetical protein
MARVNKFKNGFRNFVDGDHWRGRNNETSALKGNFWDI